MLKLIRLTVLLQAFGYLFQFVAFFLFANMLGSENQGILSIFRSTGQIIASLILLGLPGGIIYFVGKDRNLFWAVIKNCLKLLLIAFPLLIIFFYAPTANKLLEKYAIGHYIPYLLMFIFFLSCSIVFEGSVLSIQKYFSYNLFTFGAGVIIFIFSISIWFISQENNKLQLSIIAYLATYGLIFFYGAILVSAEIKKIYHSRIKQPFWEQFRVGIRVFISTISATLLYRLDLFLVGYFLSLKEVGVYSIALFGIEMLTKIPAWSASILTPMVASNERGHIKRTVYLFYSAIIGTLLFGFIFLLAVTIFSDLVIILIGEDFRGVEMCMLLLLPRIIMQSGVVILAANLAGKGYPWYHPLGCAIPLILLVLLDVYLIPRLGINGAALGNSLSYISATIIFWLGFVKYNDLHENLNLKTYWVEVRGYLKV
jgi:O-antigen/teichoic acid export membrane protein